MSRSRSLEIALAAAFVVLAPPAAADGGASPTITSPHLVRLGGPSLARRPGGLAGPLAALEAERLAAEQERALAAIGARIGRSAVPVHRYRVATNGFALDLTPEEAEAVAALPGVAAVQPSRNLRPASDAGPAWIGAPGIWDGTATGGLPGTQGEGVVIGVVDTGINMTHPSFADVGGDGFDHINPRGAGNFVGFCDPGNPDFDPSLPCNDKLIGVWSFPNSGDDPRDDHGHGSHVASVAAGNRLPAATPFPDASLTVSLSGVAPHASLIAYDACDVSFGSIFCSQTDVLAAIDQAVVDGVDVLNLSLLDDTIFFGGPWDDPVALALLAAREAEVVVVSAVEDFSLRPPDDAPWVISASAATHNRLFGNAFVELAGGGTTPPADLVGTMPSAGFGPAPIVDASAFGNDFCDDFAPGTFTGQIVLCRRFSGMSFVADHLQQAGAGGVVFIDIFDDGPTAETLALPAVLLSSSDGFALRSWLASGSGHTGRIAGVTRELDPAGGDRLFPVDVGPGSVIDVVKLDLAAPGVDVLAAWKDPGSFALRSGASIASAVVAGAAALLVDLHPDWSPAEVQSALVTTGLGTTLFDFFLGSSRPATPHEEGGGRIDLAAAARAGLLLDESPAAFAAADPDLGGLPGALNLPGLAEDFCLDSCSWTRTVESAAAVPTHWTASATVPPGMSVTVTPSSFDLAPGAAQDLEIELSGFPSGTVFSEWVHGAVTFTESGDLASPARLPLAAFAIARLDLSVTMTGGGSGQVTSSPAGIACPPDCTDGFPHGSSVTLTAVAKPGSTFAGWGGDCFFVSSTTTCSHFMNSDRQVTAFFVPEPPDLPLANRVPLRDGFQGPVPSGLTKHYFVDVPPGTAALVVDLFDLTREALLLVRFGQKTAPAQCSVFADSFFGPEVEPARCSIAAPQAGRWWIGVNNGETQHFEYSVRASWGTGSESEAPLPNGGAIGDFVTAPQSGEAFKFYSLDVEPGSTDLLVELTELSADADLYLRFGAKPSATTFDCASTAGSTLDESCHVGSPEGGRWWVGVRNFSAGTVVYRLSASWSLPAPASFFTVTPCRVFDTRLSAALASNVRRSFAVAGTCGIPASARAVAANVTVVFPTGQGHVTLFSGTAATAPLASTINFSSGQVRANNAILPLGTDGTIAALPVMLGGQTDLILDVVGYFE